MSNINTNLLSKAQAHSEALIGYVLDAKPYHVKLSSISERYDVSDEISVSTSDEMSSKIFVGADSIDPTFANRATSNSWRKSLVSDANTRTFQIPTVAAHKFESEMVQRTLIAGTDNVLSIPGINPASTFIFENRRHDGPSISDVRKNGVQQQEAVDYFLSEGSLSFTVAADGTWLESFVPATLPRNSGIPQYEDSIQIGAAITNISGGNYDSWTLTCIDEATGALSVVGDYSGNVGTAILGSSFFSPGNIQFDCIGDGSLALGAQIILSPKNKIVALSTSIPQTWTLVKTNPLSIASKAVFTGAIGSPSRQTSVHIHAQSLARSNSSATWRIEFTSPTVYSLIKTGSDPVTVTGIDLRDGCSFKNDQIHFTIQAPIEGFFTGDFFTFSTVPSTGDYLVFGSVSGWMAPAKIGKWYWNGQIGFKIPKLQYLAKTKNSGWSTIDLLSQSGWFTSTKDVHTSAVPSVYTITFQPPVPPATTVSYATVHNNVYGFRAGLTVGQIWEDEFCSFIVSPVGMSAGDTFEVYLLESASSTVSTTPFGYGEAGYDLAEYDAIEIETTSLEKILQKRFPLPDNHGALIFRANCVAGDEVIINASIKDLFSLQINAADNLFPELASVDGWVPLEFRYFDRLASTGDGKIANFPDTATTIEAYLCSAPTVKVLTVTQPRYQCSSRNSSALMQFDSAFFRKYLKFGTKFIIQVDQDMPTSQRARVSVSESLSIQIN